MPLEVLCSSVLMPVLTPTCWDSADYQPAFFQIHASLTASFETSSLRSEAESSGLGSPEQGWERQVPCNSNGLSGLPGKDGISEISAPRGPLTTVLCGCFYLWDATPGTGTTGKERARSPARVFHDHAHQVSRNPLCTEHESSSRTHTCPGESDGVPPRALARPERLPEKDLAGEPSDTQNKEGLLWGCGWVGSSIFTLEASVQLEMREPQCQTAQLKGTICERGHEEDQGRRWGLYLTSFPAEGILNSWYSVVAAKWTQWDWSTARWGAEVITAVTVHPITSATVALRFRGSVYMLTRKIYRNSDRNAPERVCCW